MPHFNNEGHDTYLCQVCGREKDSISNASTWRPEITGNKSAGNVCPECLANHEKPKPTKPLSLYEHCKLESGLTDHNQIMRYLNRHYGHG